MITSLQMDRYGPISSIAWNNLGPINLVIGGNGTGKTTILKAMYSAIRAIEGYGRGDDDSSLTMLLSRKLRGVFQPGTLGNMVTKGAVDPLRFKLEMVPNKPGEIYRLRYNLGPDTHENPLRIKIGVKRRKDHSISPRNTHSIFLPAKEVLSLHKIIMKSRLEDKLTGFDDTYLDLAIALDTGSQVGKDFTAFSQARKALNSIVGGKVAYDETEGRWYFIRGTMKHPMSLTAEGIKKIGILDTLLSNRYLNMDSIVFIDEPEAALHPKAIASFLDILASLALANNRKGIQFFLASHSYYVVKKLHLIAQKQDISIPILHEEEGEWRCENLRDGMPTNGIINESIRLYEEEVDWAL